MRIAQYMTSEFLSDVNHVPAQGHSIIYLYTFSDGTQYIGQTKFSALTRYKAHLHANMPVDRKLRKCPHSIYIVGEYPDDIIDRKEQLFIQVFDTLHPNGWNMDTGGNVNKTISEESRRKSGIGVSKAHKSGVFDEKYKEHSRIMTEYHATHEHPMSIKVICLETGKVYDNEREVCNDIGVTPTRLSSILNGKNRNVSGITIHGYHYARYDSLNGRTPKEVIDDIESTRIRPMRVIRAEDMKEYDNIYLAAEELNVSYSAIRKCIAGLIKAVKGYHFFKKGDFPNDFTSDEILKILTSR